MCGTVSEAEDATQETFVSAYRGLRDFKSGASLDTWIHRIAVNACLMRRRKRATDMELAAGDVDSIAPDIPSTSPDPLSAALSSELSNVVRAAVNRLPEPQQSVVLLHGMQGFTYAEIASILECPIGTVKSRISAAFTSLRHSLGGYVEPETVAFNAAPRTTEASL
jgi:RNA polymerase sigma-70 factor (ECF subfamily)